jgi:hypothetical protein
VDCTPAALLFDFLRSLPVTIRSSICLQVVHTRELERRAIRASDEDMIELIADRVSNATSSYLAVAAAIGAIEYALSRPPINHHGLARSAVDIGDNGLLEMALAQPLRERHLEQARASWTKLRATSLSYPALHEAEIREMVDNPILLADQQDDQPH